MLRIHQIKLPLSHDPSATERALRKKIGLKPQEKLIWRISRESLDLRKASEAKVIYSIDVKVDNEEVILRRLGHDAEKVMQPNKEQDIARASSGARLKSRPVVIGFGPAGMFAAEFLSRMGYSPIIIERGSRVEKRVQDIEHFWAEGILDVESNVQFGEGGAGTFSDGKLTSRSKDPRGQQVLELFAALGAPDEIRYRQKPHIGTDLLRNVVVEMRKRIESQGGTFLFDTRLDDLERDENSRYLLKLSNHQVLSADAVVLAIGHSARDTFEMLLKRGVELSPKPFAVGVRIEHLQEWIDQVQYGVNLAELRERYGAADYQLTAATEVGKGVYTFCMCPGGEVVAAASERGGVVTNGMSEHARNLRNANSALLVTVSQDDFENQAPLAGVEFQRRLERAAYQLGGGTYSAPYMTVGEFLDRQPFDQVQLSGPVFPSYRPAPVKADFRSVMPPQLLSALQEGLLKMGEKIEGFSDDRAILTAFETRTSSPVRIIRDDQTFESVTHPGVYPCGEGAGYAGGITSSGIDGMKAAEHIMRKWMPAVDQ